MVSRHYGAVLTGNPTYGSIPEVKVAPSTRDLDDEDDNKDTTASTRHVFWNNGRSAAPVALLAMLLIGFVLLLRAEDPRQMRTETSTSTSTSDSNSAEASLNAASASTTTTAFLLDDALDEKALYYEDQAVDHLHADDGRTYRQRYYKRSANFRGPGHPILVIMGGEAALEPPMLYPFVNRGLASEFGAFVVSPEHRFYGTSQPVDSGGFPTVPEMMAYLSPDQALEDAVQLIEYVRAALGCDPDETHPGYCPVITFGGSYPGFLSAMLRFRFPDIVDGSYASSAPLQLYSQEVDANKYFDKVTEVAEGASEGCSDNVRSTLFDLRDELYSEFGDDSDDDNIVDAAKALGFCPSTFPTYIETIEEFVSEAIQYLVPAIFADFNMGYYPPGPATDLARACDIFGAQGTSPKQKIREFFALRGKISPTDCYDVALEIPAGPSSKIRGSDNSGSGGGLEGRIWEFQCCKDLIVGAGYSPESMFLPRPFSYEWHKEHCEAEFPGIAAGYNPTRMNDEWGFSDLSTTSRIVFANGLHDGWETSSITNATAVSEQMGFSELSVINFPNGAHHSELKRGPYPNPRDTDDIVEGYQTATTILSGWLEEMAAVAASGVPQ